MADDELLGRIRAILAPRPLGEQKMFGGTCFMLAGNMLVGASTRGLLVRVGKEAHAKAIARPHARPMVMRGREMEGYVFVDPAGVASDADLRGWLNLALAYVGTLPAKEKSVNRRRFVREGARGKRSRQ
jgi:hypothetical protein